MSRQDLPAGSKATAYVVNAMASANKDIFLARVTLLFIGILGVFATLSLLTEVALVFTVMKDLFGPDKLGDTTPIEVFFLSFASVIAMAAFHLYAARHADHVLVELMRKLSGVFIVLFFVGLFMLLTSNDFAKQDALSANNILASMSDNAEESETLQDVLSSMEPYLGMISSLALGGLIFLNLLIVDVFADKIRNQLPDTLGTLTRAHHAKKRASTFLSKNARLDALQQQQKSVMAELTADDVGAATLIVEDAMQPGRMAHQELLLRLKAEDGEKPSADLPYPCPTADDLETYLAELAVYRGALADRLRQLANLPQSHPINQGD